jgi:outer membrane protein OmpA-like peptidoglycan-associated protein
MKKIVLIVGLIYCAVLGSGKAQVLSGNLGTSWLKISPSTRNAGMGDSALAVPDAYDEADINPAALGLIGGTNLSLSQNFYIQDISAQHLIFTQAAPGGDGFSLGVNYMSFGSISNFNVAGNVLTASGSYSPIGVNFYAAYGMGLGDGLRAGLTGHFIYDNIQQSFPDQTVALDAGLYYHLPDHPFYLSLVMSNLGWNIDDATLPLQVKAGGAYQLFGSENESHSLMLSGEVDTFLNDGNYAQLGLGAEYWYKNLIALRAGYQFSNIGDLTGLTGLSLGAGIKYWNWQLDYALISLGELGVANQISLSVKLGDDAKPTATPTPTLTPTVTQVITATATPMTTPETVSSAPPPPMAEVPVENTPTMVVTPAFPGNTLTVYFAYKASFPYDKDLERLNKLAEFLLANPDQKITIDGYADDRGPDVVNMNASVARAGLVKNYLIQKDVPAEAFIWAKGHGVDNPATDASTEEGRALNRRVVIQWVPSNQASSVSAGASTGTLVEDGPEESEAPPPKLSIVSAKKWWSEPFDAETAYDKLINKIVPALVNQHQLVLLGDHRQLFFDEARKRGVKRRRYVNMVSGYYTAIAKNLIRLNRVKQASFYLHLALVYQAYNLNALKIQPQIQK